MVLPFFVQPPVARLTKAPAKEVKPLTRREYRKKKRIRKAAEKARRRNH